MHKFVLSLKLSLKRESFSRKILNIFAVFMLDNEPFAITNAPAELSTLIHKL